MKKLAVLMALCIPCYGQHGGTAASTAVATVIFTATLSSNASSTGIVVAPTRKQLGNVGTGCNGATGTITPTGVPVGQLYATTAIQTAAEAATPTPCATQGVVSVTSPGTGISAMDNGQGGRGDGFSLRFNRYVRWN